MITAPSRPPADRCVLFVDGANLYNRLKDIGIRPALIDIDKVASKLTLGRQILQIRYYIPKIDRTAGRAYQANRELLASLRTRPRVHVSTGYIQRVKVGNECADELLAYLGGLRIRLPRRVYGDLVALAKRHSEVEVYQEKGVDVALACDMLEMALKNAYDVAYLLSADGDFCPAVRMVRALGSRVFAASPVIGQRLQVACDASIRLNKDWFRDCTV